MKIVVTGATGFVGRHLVPELLSSMACKVDRYPRICQPCRRTHKVSRARAIISYLAAKKAGYTQTQIADHLNISRIGVRNSIIRGQKMIDKCEGIWQKSL